MKARQMAHMHECQKCHSLSNVGEFVGAEADLFMCGPCLEESEHRERAALARRGEVIRRAVGREME